MSKETEVLQWAHKQAELIMEKFSSLENLPVRFNDFDSLKLNIDYPIPGSVKGNKEGRLKLLVNGSETKTIDYKFYKGTVLEIHHHPDYTECFTMLSGSMVDELTGIERHEGEYFEMLRYIPHQWICTKDAHMRIDCKKV